MVQLPIEVLRAWGTSKSSLKTLRVLLVLKQKHGGKFSYDQMGRLAQSLHIPKGEVEKQLWKLVKRKCIGISADGRFYHLRSWKFIGRLLGINVGQRVRIRPSDLHLAEGLFALQYMLSIHRGPKLSLKRIREGKKALRYSDHHGGISCSLLAKFLGTSKTSAWRVRKALHDKRYIRLVPRWFDTGIPEEFKNELADAGYSGRYTLRNGTWQGRFTDKIVMR